MRKLIKILFILSWAFVINHNLYQGFNTLPECQQGMAKALNLPNVFHHPRPKTLPTPTKVSITNQGCFKNDLEYGVDDGDLKGPAISIISGTK